SSRSISRCRRRRRPPLFPYTTLFRSRGDRLDRAELAAVLGEQALASTHLTTRSPRVPRELREAGPHEAPAHCERERRARAPPAHPSERGPGLVDLARRGVRLGGREPRVTHAALRPRAVLALRERGRGRR